MIIKNKNLSSGKKKEHAKQLMEFLKQEYSNGKYRDYLYKRIYQRSRLEISIKRM